MEAVSGVALFAIFDPDVGILESYVATEWEEPYQDFIELSEKQKMFMMELTQADFEFLREAYTPPPTSPRS